MSSSTSIAPQGAESRKYSREIVLLITLLLLLLSAVFTAFAARMYHKKYHVLGDEWFARGEQDFHAGNATAALRDYRNALLFSPGNTNFEFHLARALAATGRDEEARAYLLSLLSESPGSGPINLELAKLAARAGTKAMPDALRYYHAAIYGVWDTDPIGMRWQIRKEFCEYLLSHNAIRQAEAEIIALGDNTSPEDIPGQLVAADMLLRARMWNRALQQYQALLKHDPHDPDVLAGAATAAFQLSQYSLAQQYFERLPRERLETADLAQMHEVSKSVVSLNPFAPGLSTNESAKRTAEALAIAVARATDCAKQHGLQPAGNAPVPASGPTPTSPLAAALAATNRSAKDWTERNLRRFPDRVEPAMQSVFNLENEAAEVCGEPQGGDYALLLIGRNQGSNSR